MKLNKRKTLVINLFNFDSNNPKKYLFSDIINESNRFFPLTTFKANSIRECKIELLFILSVDKDTLLKRYEEDLKEMYNNFIKENG